MSKVATVGVLTQPHERKPTSWVRVVVVCVATLLAALYFTGRLDYALYPLGLNFHACARNGLGATFCGHDLTVYQQHWNAVEQQIRTLTGGR